MKTFLIKSVLFIFPLIIAFIFLEYKLGTITNSYSFKKAKLEQKLDSIEVLVLGSSQATYGINPDYFDLYGFNLSNISQSLFYDCELTLKYADRMPKLRYVLINISYFSFGYEMTDGIEKWRDFYYSQYWDIEFPELDKLDLRCYSKVFLYTPRSAASYCVNGFDVNLVSEYMANGSLKMDTVDNHVNINDEFGKQRVQFHRKQYKEERIDQNLMYLDHLVKELKRRNIQPILITPPVLSTYSRFADTLLLNKNNELITSLCSKYDTRYVDYFNDPRFVKRDFKDNDHLNFIGAEKFSRIINDELLTK